MFFRLNNSGTERLDENIKTSGRGISDDSAQRLQQSATHGHGGQGDLPRFMGDWYVIANIPTFLEKDAYNPVESYALNEDGTIATTFTFNDGSFEGEEKVYHPQGFIRNSDTNAEWGMQFLWPIKADYRIVYLDEDYQYTVIGRNSRDYVWIMARNAQIPDQTTPSCATL